MVNSKIVLPNLSYLITGILFKTHRDLGRFELEKIYRDQAQSRVAGLGLQCQSEYCVKVKAFNGRTLLRYLDLLVENLVIVELKASSELFSSKYLDQVKSYLVEANLPLGIVANFHGISLKPIRVLNPSFKEDDLTSVDSKYLVARNELDKIRKDSNNKFANIS